MRYTEELVGKRVSYAAIFLVAALFGIGLSAPLSDSLDDISDTSSLEKFFGKFQPELDQKESIVADRNLSVVMISIETLRADHLPCYGYYRNTTPEMCGFAKENLLFEDSMAQATWTIPSEASVFTGQYPMVHGVQNRSDKIPESKQVMSESIPDYYQKAAFTGGMDVGAQYGFDQGFETYEAPVNQGGFNETIPLAKEWLDQNSDERFFLFLQSYDPHSPYEAPEPYEEMFVDNYTGILQNYTIGADIQKENWILDQLKRYPGKNYSMTVDGERIQLTEEDINYTIDRYDGNIRYTDQQLGNFFDYLKEEGLYNDTVVIVYSNHGEALNDHVSPGYYINGHRRAPFSEQVHVPLMLRIPGVESERIDGPVALIDIYPTIMDILGVEISDQVQGKSLLPTIREGEAKEPVFTEGAGIDSEAVITDSWKYLYIPDYYGVPLGGGDTRILYSRSENKEKSNVYEQFPEIGGEMEDLLTEWKFSNIRQQSDANSDPGKDQQEAQEDKGPQTSPHPPRWWTEANQPPSIKLKEDFCQKAQLAMGNTISPEFRVCVNDGGFRDRGYSVEKPEDTFRIAALGDAVTFGVGLNSSQTWPNQLQAQLKNGSAESKNYQVLNFGLPFKTTKEEVEWFELINGTEYDPDLLVLQYMENDAENLSRITELERQIKANLSDNLTEDQKNRVAITRAIERERAERQNMTIEREMEAVVPYLDRLENLSEAHDFEILVMYYATQFSERHIPFIRNASKQRGWYFMVSDLDDVNGSHTYDGTFNLKPSGAKLTAAQVREKIQSDILNGGKIEN